MTKPIQHPSPHAWIAILLILAGCDATVVAQPASAGATLEVVVAGKPTRKTLTLVSTQPARLEALEQAPIHSKLGAYVGRVLADFGDQVKQGQPLVQLVAPEVDADLAQKKALLEQARAEHLQSQAGARAAEAAVSTAASKIAQAEAGIDRAKADVARWRSEYSRLSQLAASGSLNRQVVDETQQKLSGAEAAMRETAAAIDAAKAFARQVEAEAAKAQSDVAAAEARIRVAEANLAQAEANHSYLTIKAPFDGVVVNRGVDVGHYVQPAGANHSPLMVVARTDKIRAFVSVPEIEAGYVDLGDLVSLELPSQRGVEIKGTVTRTGFALDPGNRSLETIIDLDNAASRLRPGLFATAKITLHQQESALTLPAAAVVRQGKQAHCYRLIGGKATKTPIQVGIKVADEFEVTSGLSDQDSVILNKAAALSDGQAVEVFKPAAKAN